MKKSKYDRLLLWILRNLNRYIAYRNRAPEDPKKIEERKAALKEVRMANRKRRKEEALRKKMETAHTAICYGCKATYIYKGIKVSNYCGGCRKKPKNFINEKQEAHLWLDALWESGRMTRDEAYNYVADLMKIPRDLCHIGMFNKDQCLLLQIKLAQSEHKDLFPDIDLV